MKKIIFSAPQAARHCSLSRGTIWKYIKTGDLKASMTPGGHYRVHKQDLEVFMRTRGMHPFGAYQPLRKKVLIVDDDAKVQKIIARLITQGGYHFEIASDGFEAGVKVMEFKPGLVILDLIMPGMDGFEVCRRIKNNPSTAHIKILAVTGYDTPENRTRIMAAGADRYLAKPFDLKALLDHVDSLLEGTEAVKVQK